MSVVNESSRQVLTFFVGKDQYAAAANEVAEVLRPPAVVRVPGGPRCLLGLSAVRGIASPVISLARLLGREETPSADSRLVSLIGESSIALSVERVGALRSIEIADDAQAGSRKPGLGQLYAIGDGSLRMLDLAELIRAEFSGLGKPPSRSLALPQAQVQAQGEATEILLEFDLAKQIYAVPLDEVVEVLPPPAQMTVVAQSDLEVLGVLNTRDRLVPVVSLSMLLGLPVEQFQCKGVIVVRIGQALVGLAVERLRGILRVPADSIDDAPLALNNGQGDAQIQSICRVPGAKRLVAILSSERLFQSKKVAYILADGGGESVQTHTDVKEATPTEQFVIFRLGAEEYGLPMAAVDEVLRLPERLTRIPKAPAFIEGILNLRGIPIPIIDQRSRLAAGGMHKMDKSGRCRVIVTSALGRRAGFIVDAVSEILELDLEQISATPALAADASRLFSRIATLQDGKRIVLLVEPEELLDRAEREIFASMDIPHPATTA